ncbi:MAG: hypothetical protein HY812_04095 [Planctomycetes bacterium]|nr:hypothetical protein [Planctomycetota bacterium]
MDDARLAELKRLLVWGEDPSGALLYFIDHLADDADFLERGVPIRHGLLESVLPEMARSAFGAQVRLSDLRLSLMPRHRFVHGSVRLDGAPSLVLFFEDVLVGMLASILGAEGGGRCAIVLFSSAAPAALGEPSRN